jgi:hypothetical protein
MRRELRRIDGAALLVWLGYSTCVGTIKSGVFSPLRPIDLVRWITIKQNIIAAINPMIRTVQT